MRLLFSFAICLLVLGCAHESPSTKSSERLQVTLVPSIHKLHLDAKWKFSLADLLATVEATKPQLICIEITESDFGSKLEGVFPPEAAFLAEHYKAGKSTATVVGTDWRADRNLYTKASNNIETQAGELHEKFVKDLENQTDRIAYLISPEGQGLTKKVHDFYIQNSGESSDGFWLTRNSKIVDNCIRQAREKDLARVTLVFGIDHFYVLKENLESADAVKLESTKIVRVPTVAGIISEGVLDRWSRNLNNLETLSSAKTTSESVRQWIAESKRTSELKQFLAAFSKTK